jgi:NADH-quinone oxidoreductase subunit B
MGACAASGGMFRSYPVMQGIDHVVPVDFYIPGCPPRPEMVLNALIQLQKKIEKDRPTLQILRRPAASPAGPGRLVSAAPDA